MSTVASLCVVLTVLWTLLAYVLVPLPVEDPFFAWLRRQWLMEGIAVLCAVGVLCAGTARFFLKAPRPVSSVPRWWGPWLCWMAWAAVSLAYSIDRGVSLRSLIAYASYGLLAWMTAACAGSPRERHLWVRFLVLAAVVVSLEGLIQHGWTFRQTLPMLERLRQTPEAQLGGWGGDVLKDFLVRKRIFSVFGWPNLFAGFLLLTIPMAIGLAMEARARRVRMAWAAAAGLLVLCLILTLSVGGWIAAILTGAVAWWLWRGRATPHHSSPLKGERVGVRGHGTTVSLARVLLIGMAACLVLFVTSFIVAKRAQGMIIGSLSSRWVYVASAAKLITARPLQGTGLGTFGLAYQTAMSEAPVEGQHTALHAHNTLFEFGAELGLIGLALFLVFLARVWRLIAREVGGGRWKVEGGSLLRGDSSVGLERGVAVGLLGFFIHSILEQTFVEAVTAPFWWIALGLLGASSEKLFRVQGSGFGVLPPSPEPPTLNVVQIGSHRVIPVGIACIIGVMAGRFAMADAWASRGAVAGLSGHGDQAIEAFEQAGRWDPLAHRYPLEEGERLLERVPPHPASPPQGGEEKGEGGEGLRRAQAAFQRAVTLSPWLGYGWMRLGMLQWQSGMREPAIASMRTAVQRDPNSRASLRQLAQMLNAAGRFEELRGVCAHLQRLEPDDPNGYFLEALAWQGLSQPEAAIRAYRALLARAPAHYPSWYNLAELERSRGHVEEARAAYQGFLLHAPPSESAMRTLTENLLEKLNQTP